MRNHLQHSIFSTIGKVADAEGIKAYVIGGYVRDLCLRRPSKDIDVVVEGSGIDFARKVAQQVRGAKVAYFKSFGTAQMKLRDVEVVFVMPRSGSYQIAFEGRTNRCTATIGQPIEILDTLVLPGSDDVPLIQQFLLSPPGRELSVRVELREASRILLSLLAADGRVLDQRIEPSARVLTHSFALRGLHSGEYIVELQVGGQIATIRFTKQD